MANNASGIDTFRVSQICNYPIFYSLFSEMTDLSSSDTRRGENALDLYKWLIVQYIP